MAGLEKLNIQGPDHLREALTNCSDPVIAIEEFQAQNGILLHSLRPALPFLDLHGVRRLDFHQSVLEELRDRLIRRIEELAEVKSKSNVKILNDLLVKTFPVIKIEQLQPAVMEILKHLPKIKQEYLQQITDDSALYKIVAIEVKQQIWQEKQSLFGDEVSPLFSSYIELKEESVLEHNTSSASFFQATPKTRRQGHVLLKLTKMVGKNVRLYDMVLQFLRTLFLRTRNTHYCTLRAELLMALHDLEIHEICSVDPCHKFTWCLDACIRENYVDSKRSRELQGFLDGVKKGQEQVLGDLSMILCDPFAIHTVGISIMKSLQHCIEAEILPRNNDDLVLLLRMLSLGLGAWDMIDSQTFKEPKIDPSIVTQFLPSILSIMIQENILSLSSQPPEEPTQLDPPSDVILKLAKADKLAASVLAFYSQQLAEEQLSNSLTHILPLLSQCDVEIVYSNTHLHSLVSHLITMADSFITEDFSVAVLDAYLLPSISQESVLRHILRLLHWVHHKIHSSTLKLLLKKIEPNNQNSDVVHQLYHSLVDKLANHISHIPVQQEKLDSPYNNVPAPTPLIQ